MNVRTHVGAATTIVALLGLGGCPPQSPELEIVPPPPIADPQQPPEPHVASAPPPVMTRAPEPVQNPAARQTGLPVPGESQPVSTTREQQAEMIAYYRLDDVQMAVAGEEEIDSYRLTDEVAQRLRETFSELGMRVQNADGHRMDRTDAEAIRRLASALDADLLTIVTGTAHERSRLGQMLSYEAEVRATVHESNGQLVATKEITTVGERSQRPERAAESALLAAANELGPYLVEQLVRKVGQNVVCRRLSVAGLRSHDAMLQIQSHLRSRPGINDVRLLSWDVHTGAARFLVYLQPAARANLGAYVAATRGLDVLILQADREGVIGHELRNDR